MREEGGPAEEARAIELEEDGAAREAGGRREEERGEEGEEVGSVDADLGGRRPLEELEGTCRLFLSTLVGSLPLLCPSCCSCSPAAKAALTDLFPLPYPTGAGGNKSLSFFSFFFSFPPPPAPPAPAVEEEGATNLLLTSPLSPSPSLNNALNNILTFTRVELVLVVGEEGVGALQGIPFLRRLRCGPEGGATRGPGEEEGGREVERWGGIAEEL